MKIKKKLTRKQFLKQEDEFISGSVKTLNWIKANYNKLIIGFIIFFIVLSAILSVRYKQKTDLMKSSQLLALAKKTYYANVQPPPKDPNLPIPHHGFISSSEKYQKAMELFNQLIQVYPGSDAAEEAEFFIPSCLHFLEKYDQAIEGFYAYIDKYPNGVFAIQALTGIGFAQKAKGEYEKAIPVFQQILDSNQDFILADAIYMEMGSCYEKIGSLDKARESYQQIVINFPDSPFLKDAEHKISILEDKG